jgi:aspartate/methionine/tyrosine aminotransferase
LVDEAVERLAFAADNYLSVATPVQLALGALLEHGVQVRRAILDRCAANLATLEREIPHAAGVALVRPEGGWSAVLRFPRVLSEETVVLELLERHGVAVQPGYFFDFPSEGWLALSLLPHPSVFDPGVRLLLERLAASYPGSP